VSLIRTCVLVNIYSSSSDHFGCSLKAHFPVSALEDGALRPRRIVRYAALLQRFGISVAVFDTMLNDPAEGFRSTLEQHRPRIVVVCEHNSKMCLTRMREVAYDILDGSRKAGAVAIVNGSDDSDQAEQRECSI
jgi:hypothetical protein